MSGQCKPTNLRWSYPNLYPSIPWSLGLDAIKHVFNRITGCRRRCGWRRRHVLAVQTAQLHANNRLTHEHHFSFVGRNRSHWKHRLSCDIFSSLCALEPESEIPFIKFEGRTRKGISPDSTIQKLHTFHTLHLGNDVSVTWFSGGTVYGNRFTVPPHCRWNAVQCCTSLQKLMKWRSRCYHRNLPTVQACILCNIHFKTTLHNLHRVCV
jgi:hypothetical protein